MPTFQLAAKKELVCGCCSSVDFLRRTYSGCVAIPDLPPNTSFMRANTHHNVRPFRSPFHDKLAESKDTFHPAVRCSPALSLPDVILRRFSEAKSAATGYAECDLVSEKPGANVIISPLGTSSAIPTKYRNGRSMHPVLYLRSTE